VECNVDFFANRLEACGMVYVEHLKVQPTYINNRDLRESVFKSLDRFMVHSLVFPKVVRYMS
jgi:hypothetical protein